MSKGKLLVVSGPSGVGKGTVISELMKKRDDVCFSVSATTRAPRPGEVDGVSYFFVSHDQFDHMIENGELLEYAQYVNNCYGTPRKYVEDKLEAGMNVVLDIEVQGASQVLQAAPEAISVFLVPPSLEILEQRLRNRGTETEEQIQGRLHTARKEYKQADFYQYIVVNDTVETAADELNAILTAAKCSFNERKNILKEVD